MSDWEDEYDADGVAISKPSLVQTVPVKSSRPPSLRGARSRETTSVGAKFGGEGEQWTNRRTRDFESNICDGVAGKNSSYSRSRTGPTECRGNGDRSGSSAVTLHVENSLVGRIIGKTQVSEAHLTRHAAVFQNVRFSSVLIRLFLMNRLKRIRKSICDVSARAILKDREPFPKSVS